MKFRILVPLHHLWIFPSVAGTTWFLTLSGLMITWLAKGQPKYPDQSNPYIAFISDIAAFQLKPLFLVGSIITAVSFMFTVYAVHFSRYDRRMYGIEDVTWKKMLSIVATICGFIAGVALILLAIMDTSRHHEEHAYLLLTCFLGLVCSALITTVVYFDQTWRPSPFRRLRMYCILSSATVFVDFCVGVAFYSFLRSGYWRTAGILEWILSFTGTFYILSFVGFVSVPKEGIDEGERRTLLHQQE